ncbi:MAG: hypothetical protein JEZ07_16090 [Phycisphaerae bacterium]|nr:hypothetical protein [Phycisphaerae bacterium]
MNNVRRNSVLVLLVAFILSCCSNLSAFEPKAGNWWQWQNGNQQFTTKAFSVSKKVGGYKVIQIKSLEDVYGGGSYYANIDDLGFCQVGSDVHDAISGQYLGIDLMYPVLPGIGGIEYGDPIGATAQWIGYSLGPDETIDDVDNCDKEEWEILGYETITVPFGTFENAMKVKSRSYYSGWADIVDGAIEPGGDWEYYDGSYEWYVPVVGMIQAVDMDEQGNAGADLLQLVDCKVSGKIDYLPDGQITPAEIELTVIGKKLPTDTISGSGEKFSLTVLIENVGQEAFEKGAKVDIVFYARNIDSDQMTIIGYLEGKSISSLKPDKIKKYSATVYLPMDLPGGYYELGASVGDIHAVVEDYEIEPQTGFIELEMSAGKITLPTAVIAGQMTKAAIQVSVKNNGNVSTEKTAIADFAIIARPTDVGDDIVLGESSAKFGNIKPGKTKKYSFKPAIPADVPEGTYDILISCSYNDAYVEFDLGQQVVVSEPFIDLTCEINADSSAEMILPGSKSKIKIPVNINNDGNVTPGKNDTVDVEVYLRKEDGSEDDILIGSSLDYKVSGLKNGKPKKLSFAVTIPATVSSGDYRYVTVLYTNTDTPGFSQPVKESISDSTVTMAGGFMELTKFDSSTYETYDSSVKGNLYGYGYSGHCMVDVDNSYGYVTEVIASNEDGYYDSQEQTYNWEQYSQGIYLESFGQSIDMGSITFYFDDLVVFPADGNSGIHSSGVYGEIEVYGYYIDLEGQATAKGEITGIKKIKVQGQSYEAVESKISLTISAKGTFEYEDYDDYDDYGDYEIKILTMYMDIKQDITYWTTADGIIKSQIKTSMKMRAPGEGSESGSVTETRELIK